MDFFSLFMVIILPVIAFSLIGWLLWRDQHGTEKSAETVRAWFLLHNFSVFSEPDTEAVTPIFPMKGFLPTVVGHGHISGHEVEVGFGHMILSEKQSAQPPMLYFQTSLSNNVYGEALICPNNARWAGELQYTELESTMFKGFLSVWTKPKKLSTAIMSPDFMDWYENQRPRPVIYVEAQTVCIMYQTFVSSETVDRLSRHLPVIVNYIEHSGALGK